MALIKGSHWIRHSGWAPDIPSEPVYIQDNGDVYRIGMTRPISDLSQWEIGPPIDAPPVFGNAAPPNPYAATQQPLKSSGSSTWVTIGGGNIPPGEPEVCDYCNGNGGGIMGGRCPVCGGSGEVAHA